MQGKGNHPLKHTYTEALPLIHRGDVTEPNNIFIHLLIYLFIVYLLLLSTAHTIQCQMIG
jgi:hypothetical protein